MKSQMSSFGSNSEVQSAHASTADARRLRRHICLGSVPDSRSAANTTHGCKGLLDHFIGAGEQRRRDFEAERLGGLQIDHQFVLGRRLHRQVARLLPL